MSKKVLLVADDDSMNRKIISKFLKDSYDIIEAADGKEAWELINSTHVDVILLDIIMPEMDGLEVLGRLRQKKEFDRIGVLVATSTKERTERAALSDGADDIVAKPYDPLVIEKRLNNILAVKKINQKDELLNDNKFDDLLNNHIAEIREEAEGISRRIQKYIEIINSNKDNYKLVAEITAEISNEAKKIEEIFNN